MNRDNKAGEKIREKESVKLKIDGVEVEVEKGATILDAANKAGLYIPTLCHDPRLEPFGACRMCLVEVEGRAKLLTACSSPAEEGMSVITSNEKINKLRRTVLELLAVHHPIDCPICDAAGECQLQNLTNEMRGSDKRRFDGWEKTAEIDRSNPLIERNLARCIGCGKCVRVCNEVQGTSAIDFSFRGFNTKIGPAFAEPLSCDFCGQCVDICPVGALQNRQYKFTTRSWLLQKHLSVCPFCGEGCVVQLGIGQKGSIVRGKSRPDVGFNEGNLCGRGRFGHDFLQTSCRIGVPSVRKNGQMRQVGWDEALDEVAKKLTGIREKYGAGAIGFLIGGRVDNETIYVAKKFIYDFIGASKVSSSSTRRYAQWVDVCKRLWGVKPPYCGAERFSNSDFILVLESEISASNPLSWIKIYEAKRKGAFLVTADYRRAKVGLRSDKFLTISPGGALELILRIAGCVVKTGGYDRSKVRAINGFDNFMQAVMKVRPSLTSDVSEKDIEQIAGAVMNAKRPFIVLSLESVDSVKTAGLVEAVANLAILLGFGPDAIYVPSPEANTRALVDSGILNESYYNTAKIFDEILAGKIKALYVIGDAPLSHLPDVARLRRALLSLEFLVVQDILINSTGGYADVLLPASAWSEHEGCFTSSAGMIQVFPRVVAPAERALPDRQILLMLGKDMGFAFEKESVEQIRAAFINEWYGEVPVINYNLVQGGTRETSIRTSSEEYKPICFASIDWSAGGVSGGDDGRLILATRGARGHNSTLSTYSAGITSVFPEPFVFINPEDARMTGLEDGQNVNVRSASGEISVRVNVDGEMRRGVVYIPVHFSEPPVLELFNEKDFYEGKATKVRITPIILTARQEEKVLEGAVEEAVS